LVFVAFVIGQSNCFRFGMTLDFLGYTTLLGEPA